MTAQTLGEPVGSTAMPEPDSVMDGDTSVGSSGDGLHRSERDRGGGCCGLDRGGERDCKTVDACNQGKRASCGGVDDDGGAC